MATKDECYDPGVNLYSDDDDNDMNNAKLSPGSSPGVNELESVFVYNDLRKGGPQSGHEGAEAKTVGDVRRECMNSHPQKCKSGRWITGPRYDGGRYKCSVGPNSLDPSYKSLHKFCYKCANELPKCPRCGQYPKPGGQPRLVKEED